MSFEYPSYYHRYEQLEETVLKHLDSTTRLKVFKAYYRIMQEIMNKQKEQECINQTTN